MFLDKKVLRGVFLYELGRKCEIIDVTLYGFLDGSLANQVCLANS